MTLKSFLKGMVKFYRDSLRMYTRLIAFETEEISLSLSLSLS